MLTKKYESLPKTRVPNLIGMTAFYRIQKGINGANRRYSMTPPAYTEVLNGKDGMRDAPEMKATLVDNLLKHTYEKQMMMDLVKAQIPQGMTLPTEVKSFLDNPDDVTLKKLLM